MYSESKTSKNFTWLLLIGVFFLVLLLILGCKPPVQPVTLEPETHSYTIDNRTIQVIEPLTTNCIWTHVELVDSNFLDNCRNGKIYNIILWIGHWEPDHTIEYWYSDAVLTDLIGIIHSTDSDFRVYPFLYWGDSPVDISSSNNRDLMYAEIEECVNKGFDGFQDDLERYTGTLTDYIAYLQGVASTVHSLGKVASAAVHASIAYNVETVYSSLTLDFVCPMFYNGGPYNQIEMAYCVPRVLKNSAVPVSCGLRIDQPLGRAYSLKDQLGWIDAILAWGRYDKFDSISIWLLDDMSSDDWTGWDNWISTKVQ